jgi:hypothetical protein
VNVASVGLRSRSRGMPNRQPVIWPEMYAVGNTLARRVPGVLAAATALLESVLQTTDEHIPPTHRADIGIGRYPPGSTGNPDASALIT